jgi:hypothetical protein
MVDIDQKPCWQCGRSEPTIGETDPDWLVCGHCGSRLMSAEELEQAVRDAEEARIKRALGVAPVKVPRKEA